LVVAAAALVLLWPTLSLRALLLAFFAWQFTHFQRQNIGLAKLIASKWAADPLSAAECRLAEAAAWCAIGVLIARPSLLGLGHATARIPGAGLVEQLATVAYVVCIAVAVVLVVRRRHRSAAASAAYLTSLAFVAPVFLFQNAEAAVTGMVVAHGLQYLFVVRWRTGQARIAQAQAPWPTTLAVVAVAVLGGAVLEALSELHSTSSLLRLLNGLYFGIVMAHFAVDGLLWRRPAGSSRPSLSHRSR
jgi:hypothetical protein